jgi:hypothetical protein
MRVLAPLRALFVVALPSVLGACGFLFVEGPPPGAENMPFFTCTRSKVLPSLDVAWGALNAVGAANALSADEFEYEDTYGYSRNTVIGVGVAWVVVSALSARSGFGKVDRCRAAIAQAATRPATDEPAAIAAPGNGALRGWSPPRLFGPKDAPEAVARGVGTRKP